MQLWDSILKNRNKLINLFEDSSRQKGLKVPKNRCCLCNKEAIIKIEEYGYLCKKHHLQHIRDIYI